MDGDIPGGFVQLCRAEATGQALQRLGGIRFGQLGLHHVCPYTTLDQPTPLSVWCVGPQLTKQLQALALWLLVLWPDPYKPSAGFSCIRQSAKSTVQTVLP